jgi:hypothetical protein
MLLFPPPPFENNSSFRHRSSPVRAGDRTQHLPRRDRRHHDGLGDAARPQLCPHLVLRQEKSREKTAAR